MAAEGSEEEEDDGADRGEEAPLLITSLFPEAASRSWFQGSPFSRPGLRAQRWIETEDEAGDALPSWSLRHPADEAVGYIDVGSGSVAKCLHRVRDAPRTSVWCLAVAGVVAFGVALVARGRDVAFQNADGRSTGSREFGRASLQADPSSAALIALDKDCHTAVQGEPCWDQVSWAKTDGFFSHPEWYPGLDVTSSFGDFQAAVHNSTPDKCPKPCPGFNSSCPEPMESDSFGTCNMPQRPIDMTFYMYRAQDDDNYPVENLNLASLAGVMWYLHREVVGSTPRKFHISRVLRYKVTMKNTKSYFKDFGKQFGPFVAFDAGSALGRQEIWDKYGFVVGCQLVDPGLYAYAPLPGSVPACETQDAPACTSGVWYSLPGSCPEMSVKNKTPGCRAKWPGGGCKSAVVTGERDCTYWAEYAGEVTLDELEGLTDYESFWISPNERGGLIPNGNKEYDHYLDRGINMSFWDYRHDQEKCMDRMQALLDLFHKKFPTMPRTLPEPMCT